MWRHSDGVADCSRGALNGAALLDDAPALALRGIEMVRHSRCPGHDTMSARSGLGQTEISGHRVVLAQCWYWEGQCEHRSNLTLRSL